MSREVTVFLNSVCESIRSPKEQLLVRAELSGHIANIMEELMAKGMEEENAEAEALRRMGNPEVIGKEIADLNSPMVNILTVIAGIIMFIMAFVFLGISVIPLWMLIDGRALLFVSLVTCALLLAGGLSRFTRRSILERCKKSALYAGVIGMMIGVIDCLSNIGSLEEFGISLAFCLTSLIYGVTAMALIGSLTYLTRPLEAGEIRRVIGREDDNL